MNAQQSLKQNQGFSLIEMAVALLITAAMTVAVVPSVIQQAQYGAADNHVDTVLTMHHALKTYYDVQLNDGNAQNNANLFPGSCDALATAGVIAQLPTNTWGGSFECTMEEIVGAQTDTIHQVGKLTVTDVPEDMAEYLTAQLPLTSCVGSTCTSTILPPNAQVAAGCMDDGACNYNPVATVDDGSCYSANAGCACEDGPDAQLDECGVCAGPGIGANGCCPGVILDQCGECGGDNSSCEDACGVPNGNDACVDACGVPYGNDACVDACGVPYGNDACVDACGVPNGNDACVDCNGDAYGTASVDDCGSCVGGLTGNTACTQDCNGDWGGSASIDNCNECVGGATGEVACVQDACGVWGGPGLVNASASSAAACYGCEAALNYCLNANGLGNGGGQGTINSTCWGGGSGAIDSSNNYCGWLAGEGYTNGGILAPTGPMQMPVIEEDEEDEEDGLGGSSSSSSSTTTSASNTSSAAGHR